MPSTEQIAAELTRLKSGGAPADEAALRAAIEAALTSYARPNLAHAPTAAAYLANLIAARFNL